MAKKFKEEIKIVDGKKVKYVHTKSGGIRKSRAKPKLGFIPKKVAQGHHHYEPEKYLAWKKAIYERDDGHCQWPKCREENGLECHHIRAWKDAPTERYSVSNGILICDKHHLLIKGKEEAFAGMLSSIVIAKMRKKIQENNQDDA
jgi:hypothetical protein